MSGLSLVNLTKFYGSVQTLKGIDLALDEGEFLVLLGPSGCGKSTILNIIAGLLEPTSGDIRIGGRSVLGVHPKDRDIAMVFQSYALYPNLTVARNIGFGLEMRGIPKTQRAAAVASVAETLQISALLDRRPAALSGGQRQRVAIGRALVRNPAVFLFDEPLSNLDAKLRMETRTEIKRLHQSLGKTMVYVTHDQIEAMTLATRIAVLNGGQLEQLGTPEEVYRRPASLFVANFIGSPGMNLLHGRIDAGKFVTTGGEASIFLPPGYTHLAQGRSVVLGIRPEEVALASSNDPSALVARVDVVELTGPEKLTLLRLGADQVMASLPPTAAVQAGQDLSITLDEAGVVLFDPATEMRIAPAR
ncbi:ABC transporter ATP-binding protein [Rubellimicrobium mesophilum]|uniref:ABC transporter ATP-binding protein n=1 Tax=Rubellimicrobium mesophilum TaxID=1123067 RepID=UPI0009E6B336|nr:sn-glycerol-3-phosphate ABC transporter ATP-binding protein UgpC [Rubellimicrobium mesophilum]